MSDTAIKNAKPKDKPYKMGDAGGLFLLAQPSAERSGGSNTGSMAGKEGWASALIPKSALAMRGRADKARALIASGKNPGVEQVRKKVQDWISANNIFAIVATAFINRRTKGTKEGWAENILAKTEPAKADRHQGDGMPTLRRA